VTGEVDVAVAWGPMAGYFARTMAKGGPNVGAPLFTLVPLEDSATLPMTFEFSMGVQKGNAALKARLEEAIDRRRAEITKILDDFGVPLLALKPPRSGAGSQEPAKDPALPAAPKHQP